MANPRPDARRTRQRTTAGEELAHTQHHGIDHVDSDRQQDPEDGGEKESANDFADWMGFKEGGRAVVMRLWSRSGRVVSQCRYMHRAYLSQTKGHRIGSGFRVAHTTKAEFSNKLRDLGELFGDRYRGPA